MALCFKVGRPIPKGRYASRAYGLLRLSDTLRVRVSPPQKARGQVVTVNQNQVDGLLARQAGTLNAGRVNGLNEAADRVLTARIALT